MKSMKDHHVPRKKIGKLEYRLHQEVYDTVSGGYTEVVGIGEVVTSIES